MQNLRGKIYICKSTCSFFLMINLYLYMIFIYHVSLVIQRTDSDFY